MQNIHLWKAQIYSMMVFIELKVNFPQTYNYILDSELLRIESQLQQSGTDSTLGLICLAITWLRMHLFIWLTNYYISQKSLIVRILIHPSENLSFVSVHEEDLFRTVWWLIRWLFLQVTSPVDGNQYYEQVFLSFTQQICGKHTKDLNNNKIQNLKGQQLKDWPTQLASLKKGGFIFLKHKNWW